MSLPVSSYEELLARVRNLTHETIQLQRELTTPISNSASPASIQLDCNENEHLLTLFDAASCGSCDNPRESVKDERGTPDASICEQNRPNSFQRPLSSDLEDHTSWSMSHRKSSGRRDRPRSSDTVGFIVNARPSSAPTQLGAFRDSQDGLRVPRPPKDKEHGHPEPKEQDEHKNDDSTAFTQKSDVASAEMGTASEECLNVASLYHGTWPVERALWHSGPTSLGGSRSLNQDACSVMSFSCSVGSCGGSSQRSYSQQQLGAKVEMVYSLLSMLGTHDREDMSRTLLAMSGSPDSCQAMRQSGCLPLLVQFLHVPNQPPETRLRASRALHNVVHSQADDKRGRREARVLRLLEQVRDYCDSLRQSLQAVTLAQERGEDLERPVILDDMERHPGPTIAALMKLSFDEEHRHAMCQLGGLHAIAELIQLDHEAHSSTTSDQYCVTLRRYAGMALTNLTFGDGTNKALLCSFHHFMKTLVAQLRSPSEDLRQVTASVLRNLSWRADGASKQTLREVSAVPGLMQAAMEGKKEATLKSILSALWNLSAHCTMNKVDICAVDGALGFLVEMLTYKAPSKTLAIVENAGGILRNISSHIAIREDYRSILRRHNCLQVLLQQLKSPSLTIVSNACGTLWNLSARCPEDQRALWDMGAVNMLRSLVHSKHKMISMGSSAALKNLLGAKPNSNYPLDSTAKSLGLPALPSLFVRKQKALEQELDQSLSETCDNIEPSTSPPGLRDDKFTFSPTERFDADGRHRLFRWHYQNQVSKHKTHVSRSDSKDSVTSTLSDTVYERITRNNDVLNHIPINDETIHRENERSSSIHGALDGSERTDARLPDNLACDKKFLRRYSNTMKQREDQRRVLSLEINNDDKLLEPGFVQVSEELGSPYSRLGHSDDVYLEKSRVSRLIAGKIQESPTLPVNSDSKTEEESGPKISKNQSAFGVQRSDHSTFGTYPFSSDCHYTSHPNSDTYPRNKFSDLEIDSGVQEEPVDYSLKYKEQTQAGIKSLEAEKDPKVTDEPSREVVRTHQNDLGRGYTSRNQSSVSTNKNIKMNVVYGDYAETDLDQPTDYSLKYAEEDDEVEFEKNGAVEGVRETQFYEGSSPILEDTLKTYYTEGTPYETPYNFSTATSMSDLRCESTAPVEKKESKEGDSTLESNSDNYHEDSMEKESQAKYLPPVASPPLKCIQSGMGSGLMSPEKPVQYCEEGTPGQFSRVSSLSSLNSIPVHADNAIPRADISSNNIKLPHELLEQNKDQGVFVSNSNSDKDEPKEGKVVTFGSTDHYAEETPLMFSRCSSLGSLSSFDQHSIHDDRSSVISDFSRRTSGIISPSELPDSPTQSVPSSPHQNKTHNFSSHLSDNLARGHSSSSPSPRQLTRLSVFEDDLTAFKEEDTPVEFSRATSLSSLTIDDEPKISNDVMSKEVPKPSRTSVPVGIHHIRRIEREKEEGMEKQDVEKEKRDLSDCCELAPVSEGEEDDEDMLAACITIGMQGGRHKLKPAQPRLSVQGAMRARLSGIPLKSSPIPSHRQHSHTSMQDTGTKSTNVDLPGACEDALLTYCTEGTPATTSHAGSHSDLSILSFPCDTDESESRKFERSREREQEDEEKRPILDLERPDFSDDSSNFSGDNDNILAECIQSGMPKARAPRIISSSEVRRHPNPGPLSPCKQHASGLDHISKPLIRRPLVYPVQVDVPARLPKEESVGSSKLPQGFTAKDEVEMFVTEGSPRTFSTRSSLSDLTVSTEGGVGGIAGCCKRPAGNGPVSEGASCDTSLRHASDVNPHPFSTEDTPLCFATEDTPLEVSHAASLSSLISADQDEPLFQHAEPRVSNQSDLSWECRQHSPTSKIFNKTNSVSEDVVTVLSRNGSLSSLSVDSFGSTEPTPSEQALLEQCINSGMPKSKEASKTQLILAHKPASRRFEYPVEDRRRLEEHQLERDMSCLNLGNATTNYDLEHVSKNGLNPSAVTSQTKPTAADVGESTRAEKVGTTNPPNLEKENMEVKATGISVIATPPAHANKSKIIHIEEGPAKNCLQNIEFVTGESFHIESHKHELASASNTGTADKVSVEVKTGDALIVSLDQLTEDLGAQSADKAVDVSAMKQSTDRDTWNDDSSPNDVSFPSMSSAPLIGSFRSEGRENGYMSELVEESDLCHPLPLAMTHSSIIQLEAEKLTTAFHAEGQDVSYDMDQSITSVYSMDLDAIKPPSMMNSLVSLSTSLSEFCDGEERSPLLSLRGKHSKKKGLPAGVMVRRALGNNHNSIDSLLDNVSISSTSQIDNVKPPSAMEELIDLADMENSMISVASITSEVAELTKEGFHLDCPGNGDAFLDIVHPPASVLAGVSLPMSDMTDATVDAGTETICSDTEICDDPAFTHTIDGDTPDLPSDSSKNTPIDSDFSSAESTPKRRPKTRLLTPKQKRQLVKERYRTYTITAEEERQVEIARMLKSEKSDHSVELNSVVHNGNVDSVGTITNTGTEEALKKNIAKITPKQRRLEDRSRFQTRVVNKTNNIEPNDRKPAENCEIMLQKEENNKASGIPKFGIKKNIKTLKEKRAAAKERFRTRTLSDDVGSISQESSSTSSQREEFQAALSSVQPTPEEVESLLERDANLIICTLNEDIGRSESDDMMLDCETLSLVSIESESEHHSKKQFVTQQNSFEVIDDGEEKTYVAEALTPVEDGDNSLGLDDEKEPLGPRITKPSNLPLTLDKDLDLGSTEDEIVTLKCVRGRRKALYNSPASRYGQNLTPSRVQMAASGSVKGTRSSTLLQGKPMTSSSRVAPVPLTAKIALKSNKSPKSMLGMKTFASVKSSTANSVTVTSNGTTLSRYQRNVNKISTAEDNKELRFKPPERQGTFTKEEGASQCIPASTSPIKTRIPLPASTPTDNAPKLKTLPDKKMPTALPSKTPKFVGSKVRTRQDLSQPARPRTAPNRLTKTLSLDGETCKTSQGSKIVNKTKPGLTRESAWVNKKTNVGELKSSVSSHTLQSQRSASSSSLNSVGSAGVSRVRKKEVTSKIASLWKRVEESQHKQKFDKKDTRVWITSAPRLEESKDQDNIKPNLIRSSTFNGASENPGEKIINTDATSKLKKKIGTRSSKLTLIKGGKSSRSMENFSENVDSDLQESHQKRLVAEVTGTVQQKSESEENTKVVLRRKKPLVAEACEGEETSQQRLSRLGSFVCVEEAESEPGKPSSTRSNPASAIVSPFNYNPPIQKVAGIPPSHIPTLVKPRSEESTTESKQNTASMRVTTV